MTSGKAHLGSMAIGTAPSVPLWPHGCSSLPFCGDPFQSPLSSLASPVWLLVSASSHHWLDEVACRHQPLRCDGPSARRLCALSLSSFQSHRLVLPESDVQPWSQHGQGPLDQGSCWDHRFIWGGDWAWA